MMERKLFDLDGCTSVWAIEVWGSPVYRLIPHSPTIRDLWNLFSHLFTDHVSTENTILWAARGVAHPEEWWLFWTCSHFEHGSSIRDLNALILFMHELTSLSRRHDPRSVGLDELGIGDETVAFVVYDPDPKFVKLVKRYGDPASPALL